MNGQMKKMNLGRVLQVMAEPEDHTMHRKEKTDNPWLGCGN
jgi:hypothetical protein